MCRNFKHTNPVRDSSRRHSRGSSHGGKIKTPRVVVGWVMSTLLNVDVSLTNSREIESNIAYDEIRYKT
ncbi:MAG: hypothetical protein QNJ32_09500 [Xenococcaceae cyanobacterium MO_167.B27]|nr:hypothetical protein [Xenococcaceae cyanobacterium MO_167.B27]